MLVSQNIYLTIVWTAIVVSMKEEFLLEDICNHVTTQRHSIATIYHQAGMSWEERITRVRFDVRKLKILAINGISENEIGIIRKLINSYHIVGFFIWFHSIHVCELNKFATTVINTRYKPFQKCAAGFGIYGSQIKSTGFTFLCLTSEMFSN